MPKIKGKEKIKERVCIECGTETNSYKCPKCGKYTEIDPGSYGMQTETEL